MRANMKSEQSQGPSSIQRYGPQVWRNANPGCFAPGRPYAWGRGIFRRQHRFGVLDRQVRTWPEFLYLAFHGA